MSDTKPIIVNCEGAGCPAHLYPDQVNTGAMLGICSMCGQTVMTNNGIAPVHTRQDILAMLHRGDFDGRP